MPVEVRMWDDLPCTLFGTVALNGFKRSVNRWLLSRVWFLPVFHGAGACGAANAIGKQFCVSHLSQCCQF